MFNASAISKTVEMCISTVKAWAWQTHCLFCIVDSYCKIIVYVSTRKIISMPNASRFLLAGFMQLGAILFTYITYLIKKHCSHKGAERFGGIVGRRHIGAGSEPPEYPLTSHTSHNCTGKIHKLAARGCSDASQVTVDKFQLECDFV